LRWRFTSCSYNADWLRYRKVIGISGAPGEIRT